MARTTAASEIGRDCLAVRVRLLNRWLTRIYDDALRPHGLTVAQLNILASVANLEAVPAGRLARLLSIDVSTLSRNTALMQREGWLISSRADRGNSRILSTTEAGLAKLEEARPAWAAAQQAARELLGEDAIAALCGFADAHFRAQGAEG